MRHGSIRPEFILKNVDIPSNPIYRLMDNIRDPPGKGSQTSFISGGDMFMSPKIFESYCRNNMKVRHDRNKSDVFSLGMVILTAGIGNSAQTIYDRTAYRV